MKSAALALLLAAGTNAAELKRVGGDAITGEYVVVMKEGCSADTLRASANKRFTQGVWNSLPGFMGFSARMGADELAQVLEDPNVAYVEPNQVMKALGNLRATDNSTATAVAQQRDACSTTQSGSQSWGLSRTTRVSGTGNYEHEPTWGASVKVYVIDTGTNCAHGDFNSACSCGPTYAGGADGCADGNGHGTHCASTATGTVYGIAKNAEVVGVKVLGDNGSGSTAGVIDGMNWVASQGAGSVASMSLGGGYSAASNAAVDGMSAAGVFVAVAAGNDGRDACSYSPASATSAFTVGATTDRDARSSFSNTGTCVDVFAPGSSITAAWYLPGYVNTISGTSMACPHVAGAAAAVLSENRGYSVAQVKSALAGLALTDVISGVGTGSPNKLLHLEC